MGYFTTSLIADSTWTALGVKIRSYFLTQHNPNGIGLPAKRTKKLLAITVHNTEDLANIQDDAERYACATINGNMGTVVPNYYADDLGGWQILPDDWNNFTNCGGGNSVGNSQTISIECIMSGQNDAESLKARDNTARLVAYLLHKYGLSVNDVVTHTYWLHVLDGKTDFVKNPDERDKYCTMFHPYKTCPLFIIPKWTEFKALISGYLAQLKGTSAASDNATTAAEKPEFPCIVKITCDELNVRSAPGTGSKVVCTVNRNEAFTVTEKQYVGSTPWGKLLSGIGWISLADKYCRRI